MTFKYTFLDNQLVTNRALLSVHHVHGRTLHEASLPGRTLTGPSKVLTGVPYS